MIQHYLSWRRCTYNAWCSFTSVDLSKIHEHGVYVIWHGGDDPRVVYIGSGDVAERIAEHRGNPHIQEFAPRGGLFVTWAEVPEEHMRLGIERNLAERYSPLIGIRHPDATPPLEVNSPWE